MVQNTSIPHTFTALSTTGIIWDSYGGTHRYYLEQNPSEYDNKSIVIPGEVLSPTYGFDNNGTVDHSIELKYSMYQISVSPGSATCTVDWQGCYGINGTGDVYITYDAQDELFTLTNLPDSDDESCLQPTDPNGLINVAPNGYNVMLEIENLSVQPDGVLYNIYRKINNGNWACVEPGYDMEGMGFWIDLDVVVGRPFEGTYLYKVYAVSSDLSKESNNPTNIVTIQGHGINNRNLIACGNSKMFSSNIYPNPANPTTSINIVVPELSQTSVKIYNL